MLNAPVPSLPDTALVPAQLPPAVQLVEFVDDHVSVDDWPAVMLVGLAEIVLVGSAICGTVNSAGQAAGVIVGTVDVAESPVIVMSAESVSPTESVTTRCTTVCWPTGGATMLVAGSVKLVSEPGPELTLH